MLFLLLEIGNIQMWTKSPANKLETNFQKLKQIALQKEQFSNDSVTSKMMKTNRSFSNILLELINSKS